MTLCILEVSSMFAAPAQRQDSEALKRLLRQPGTGCRAQLSGIRNFRRRKGKVRARARALEVLEPVPLPEQGKPRLRPTSTQAQKSISLPNASNLRRRTKPRCQPPQRPRAPFTPLAAFVSRNLLRPSTRSAFLFLHSPHPESQVGAGTPPLPRIHSLDPPRLRPPSLFGSRRRKEPKHGRKKPKPSP